MKPIVLIPNDVLTSPAKTVTAFDKKLTALIADMKVTLAETRNPKGVGLAATQVGVPWRVFVIKPTEKSAIRAFINPEVIETKEDDRIGSAKPDTRLEGCLSIPAVWGKVNRAKSVRLRYQDETGMQHEEVFTDFPAVIIQHETDHLNGVLFTQRVLEQNNKLYQSGKDKQGKEVLDEIKI
jgi:peptide deformylase